jgi:hypothetical protein
MKRNAVVIFTFAIIIGTTFSISNGNFALNSARAETTVTTPQITQPGIRAVQSNNVVNTQALYDIIFRTTSAGIIKNIELTFPTGSNLNSAVLLEVSGVGSGSASISGQKLTYSISTAANVPSATTIRLEVGNIVNPILPSSALTVQVTTKDAAGAVIDSGTSAGYPIKQIGSTDIANNAITTTKIQDGQVGTNDLADNSVSTTQFGSKLADNAVTTPKIANNSITSPKIQDGQVVTQDIRDSSITSGKLADNSVTTLCPPPQFICTSKLADNAVVSSKIAPGAVRPEITSKWGAAVTIPPGSDLTYLPSSVACDPGELVTGGGYSTYSPKIIVMGSYAFGTVDWKVQAFNTGTVPATIRIQALCLKLVP